MNSLVKHASMVSAVALLSFGSAGAVNAQSNQSGDKSDYCIQNPDRCGPQMDGSDEEDGSRRRKRDQSEDQSDRSDQSRDEEFDQPRKAKQAQSDWKYDSNRHKRRRSKDDEFRFYFGGFWYPQPYWQGYGYQSPYRIGCAEGRAIVRDRGYYRVRTVECEGRTFTYLGRRHGDTFRVTVSSRTGRIVDVDRI
jgi:hypothetical protein